MNSTTNQPTPESLQLMKLDELIDYKGAVLAQLNEAKTAGKMLEAEIDRRFDDNVAAAYAAQDKQHGTIRIPMEDNTEVVASTSKTVNWDQAALKAIAASMDWPTVNHFFSIKFSVPEKVYTGLAPDDPRKAAFDAARTVKYGTPSISIQRADKLAA